MHLAEEVKDVTREIGATHDDLKDQITDILDAADTILLCVSHQNTLVDDILSFSKLDSMMLSLVPRGMPYSSNGKLSTNNVQRSGPNGSSPKRSRFFNPSSRQRTSSFTMQWTYRTTNKKLTTSSPTSTE
jgi:hypothetical protein